MILSENRPCQLLIRFVLPDLYRRHGRRQSKNEGEPAIVGFSRLISGRFGMQTIKKLPRTPCVRYK